MTEEDQDINRLVKAGKEQEAIEWRDAREKFISIVDAVTVVRKNKERAVALFDAFGPKYASAMIDIFYRIKYLELNGKPPRKRERKEINKLLFRVLGDMEKYKEQPPNEPRLVHKDSWGFAMGSQEELFLNIYNEILHEPPRVTS